MNQITVFIQKLTDFYELEQVENFYKDDRKRTNLIIYLQEMLKLKPRLMLVGEAPGYKGCAICGIPFTSEFIMINNPYNISLFREDKRYLRINSSKLSKENTATIMWEALNNFEEKPLLWNAFPFHPYEGNNKYTNRKPNSSEIEIGKEFISILKNLFKIKKIIAIGDLAEQSLRRMNLFEKKIRHPSHGGKQQFIKELKDVYVD